MARAQLGKRRAVHVSGLSAIADPDALFSAAAMPGEPIIMVWSRALSEFAFEHRAFAGDDAVVPPHLVVKKRRKNVGQVDLLGIAKIAAGALEILRHHGKRNVLRAERIQPDPGAASPRRERPNRCCACRYSRQTTALWARRASRRGRHPESRRVWSVRSARRPTPRGRNPSSRESSGDDVLRAVSVHWRVRGRFHGPSISLRLWPLTVRIAEAVLAGETQQGKTVRGKRRGRAA